MKKQYILMGATMVFAALFASCSQENIMDEAFSQSEKEIVFDLGISQTRPARVLSAASAFRSSSKRRNTAGLRT